MRHKNTAFHQMLQLVPWGCFDTLVAQYRADAGVRRLPTKSQFVAMLYGQFSGASSLREIVTGLQSHASKMYHLGAAPPRRATLADANEKRSAKVFLGLFAALAAQAHRQLRRKVAETVYLIDASSLPLNRRSEAWAHFSAKACGAKMHIIYDANAATPIFAHVGCARQNDITAAHAMPIERGATYVFDLGYYDYAWWAKFGEHACRIVTRFKRNTTLSVIQNLPLPAGSNIISDRIGFLPERQARNRHNPVPHAVREVVVLDHAGKPMRLLSNDLEASAEEIADLYRQRWQIELFFRWVKQSLAIKRFIGTSLNAVRIQIAVALIAYLLVRLAHAAQSAVPKELDFFRLLKTQLFHRRPLNNLLDPPPTEPRYPGQLSIQLA